MRNAALVMDIIEGKVTVSETCRTFDVSPFKIEKCVDEVKLVREGTLKATLFEIKKLYGK